MLETLIALTMIRINFFITSVSERIPQKTERERAEWKMKENFSAQQHTANNAIVILSVFAAL